MFTRWLIFCSFCVCLIFYSLAIDVTPKLEMIGPGEYCFYVSGQVPSSSLIDRVINNMVFCDSKNAKAVRALLPNIKGESITIENLKKDVLKTLNYQKVKVNNFGIYAYSVRNANFVRLDNKKINLQIAVRGNFTTIGFPIILGSY